jgi:hypothetical protein
MKHQQSLEVAFANSKVVETYLNQHQEIALTHKTTMLVSLTVGKVDAGVAVLLTQDKRLV